MTLEKKILSLQHHGVLHPVWLCSLCSFPSAWLPCTNTKQTEKKTAALCRRSASYNFTPSQGETHRPDYIVLCPTNLPTHVYYLVASCSYSSNGLHLHPRYRLKRTLPHGHRSRSPLRLTCGPIASVVSIQVPGDLGCQEEPKSINI